MPLADNVKIKRLKHPVLISTHPSPAFVTQLRTSQNLLCEEELFSPAGAVLVLFHNTEIIPYK